MVVPRKRRFAGFFFAIPFFWVARFADFLAATLRAPTLCRRLDLGLVALSFPAARFRAPAFFVAPLDARRRPALFAIGLLRPMPTIPRAATADYTLISRPSASV
jgi:hypothetical protein